MKRLSLWGATLAFVFFETQALASPAVEPPPEGYTISSNTEILCEGTVMESERFNWTYFEGKGDLKAVTAGADAAGHPIMTVPGFQEGAEIAYEQDFKAVQGTTSLLRSVPGYGTLFKKDFRATSDGIPNLAVRKTIVYNSDPARNGFATHTEKVGISVVSCGGGEGGSIADGLLTLCPWGASGSGGETPGYPATNEGIAAGSTFTVTNIRGFNSETKVISTEVPVLAYAVEGQSGHGVIRAGFVVDLWEGATRWGSHDIGICDAGQHPAGVYAIDDPPAVQSRTSYAERVAVEGVWTFTKEVMYQSAMPDAGAQNTVNPFVRIP